MVLTAGHSELSMPARTFQTAQISRSVSRATVFDCLHNVILAFYVDDGRLVVVVPFVLAELVIVFSDELRRTQVRSQQVRWQVRSLCFLQETQGY